MFVENLLLFVRPPEVVSSESCGDAFVKMKG
jgi:hypothetical protein